MKKVFLLSLMLLTSLCLTGQVPQAFNYQGVARDLSGNPIAGRNIGLRVAILQGAPSGTEVYKEIHLAETSNLGLFTIQIGTGNVLNGDFSTIDWGNGTYFLQIEMDENGGSNFQLIGTSQLLSVPYALYAAKAGETTNSGIWELNANGIHYDNGNVGIGASLPNTNLEIAGSGTDADGDLPNSIVTIKNDNYSRYRVESFSNVDYRNAQFQMVRARGTKENPLDVFPGDRVGGIYAHIYSGGELAIHPIATIEFFAGKGISPTSHSGYIKFSTAPVNSVPNRVERMRIDEDGNIGIGTSTPNSRLQIKDGDIFLEDIESGVIMKSPNGNCWRMTLDNNGDWIKNQITCPN